MIVHPQSQTHRRPPDRPKQGELPDLPERQWCECRRCGRKLRNPKAMAAGIGKVCARKEEGGDQ